MVKTKEYKYIGRNGIIVSRVKLDGINFIPMLHLEAKPGYILTDGERYVYAITIEEDDVLQWLEVEDNLH